jgi:hypothetical protein
MRSGDANRDGAAVSHRGARGPAETVSALALKLLSDLHHDEAVGFWRFTTLISAFP